MLRDDQNEGPGRKLAQFLHLNREFLARDFLALVCGIVAGILVNGSTSGELRSYISADAAALAIQHDQRYALAQSAYLVMITIFSFVLSRAGDRAWFFPFLFLGMLVVHPAWMVSDAGGFHEAAVAVNFSRVAIATIVLQIGIVAARYRVGEAA